MKKLLIIELLSGIIGIVITNNYIAPVNQLVAIFLFIIFFVGIFGTIECLIILDRFEKEMKIKRFGFK